ncbi:MAG: ABC transporter substrate-binding protein [Clostridia bacterium]|nr:ABC transporter substrate-binding protein [Clostridia bacterium]MBQ1554414.1 ABC transporter substrate-binding protein [Clostridia bacterium]
MTALKRRVMAFLTAVFLLWNILPLSGCGGNSDSTPNYPVEVSGVKFVSPPTKIVCFSSTMIGIIYEMGFEKQLIGRTKLCDYSEAEEVKAFGTADSPSIDLIKGNHVDVVVTDETMPQSEVDKIQAEGVPVVVIPRATGRASLADMYSALGCVFQGGNKGYHAGRRVANRVLAQLDDISRMVENEEVWNTCIIITSDMSRFATGDTLISSVLECVGGFNVAKDSTNGEYSLPDMMRSDPDVIICPLGVNQMLRSNSSLVGVPAMDNYRVYSMDMSVFDDQYEGVVKGAWRMAYILHPEVITEDVIPEGMLEEVAEEDEDGVFL